MSGTKAYAPVDTLKPVADGVWVVDSGPFSALGLKLPIRMTVVRLKNGDLLLYSPTRHVPALQRELQGIGRIRHLFAPNTVHWTLVKEWQDACPDTVAWAVPGLAERWQVKASGVRFDRELGGAAAEEWADEIEQGLVQAPGFAEAWLFHRASATLVLCDLVANLEPDRLGGLERAAMGVAGTTAPDGRATLPLRALLKVHPAATREAAARLVALKPERLVFAHGAWFAHDAAAALERSLEWAV